MINPTTVLIFFAEKKAQNVFFPRSLGIRIIMSFKSSPAAKPRTYMYVCYNLNTFSETLMSAYPF